MADALPPLGGLSVNAPPGPPPPSVRDLPRELTDEVLDRVNDVFSTIVDGIGDGVFPAHPDEEAYRVFNPCPYCDPDDLGTRDRRREWERKAAAPDLRPYLRLADPDRAARYDSREAGG